MEQTKTQQPRGDFYAPLNRYKQPGDDRPMFSGTLSKPGEDPKLPFSLWAFDYTDTKTGELKTGYSGGINGVATNVPAAEQIAALKAAPKGQQVSVANLTLRPGQVVLFENGFKHDEPQPKHERPDLWGWVNPTDGTPPFQTGVWLRTFEDSNRPYLSGATQYPLPGKSEREQQDAAAELEAMVASGKVSKGMPKRREREGRE